MWIYKNKEFTEDISEYDSFVYLITRLSDDEIKPKYYIGKKTFWFKNRKKIPGRKTRKIIKTESNWVSYYGSSNWLEEVINEEGKENFRREIIHLCSSKGESYILEAKEQMQNNVLSKKYSNGIKKFYNKHILGKYTKEYFSTRELTELMSFENDMNPCGMIWITNGTESKQIKEIDEILSGWERGYHFGKNYCWVNNGRDEKKILRSDINSLIYREWNVGRLYSPSKNKKCIHKGDNIKYITKEEVDSYVDDGWVIGNTKLRKTLEERNKLHVCNDDSKTQKLVSNHDIKNFLLENPTWRIGQFKRGNFTTENKVFAYDMMSNEKVQVTKDEYNNNKNLTSVKTRMVKVKRKNKIVFEGFLPLFFQNYDVPTTPFNKKLRLGDTTKIVIIKGKNKWITDEGWSIVEITKKA